VVSGSQAKFRPVKGKSSDRSRHRELSAPLEINITQSPLHHTASLHSSPSITLQIPSASASSVFKAPECHSSCNHRNLPRKQSDQRLRVIYERNRTSSEDSNQPLSIWVSTISQGTSFSFSHTLVHHGTYANIGETAKPNSNPPSRITRWSSSTPLRPGAVPAKSLPLKLSSTYHLPPRPSQTYIY
jgi:hypothetical protein